MIVIKSSVSSVASRHQAHVQFFLYCSCKQINMLKKKNKNLSNCFFLDWVIFHLERINSILATKLLWCIAWDFSQRPSVKLSNSTWWIMNYQCKLRGKLCPFLGSLMPLFEIKIYCHRNRKLTSINLSFSLGVIGALLFVGSLPQLNSGVLATPNKAAQTCCGRPLELHFDEHW